MCGICGILSWESPPSENLVKKMNQTLAHRGPDADGVYVDSFVGLGHRRLAIIDLSAAGQQPMADSTETFWVVFNGEIYNYQEIRRQLQALGVRFRTRTDTEVILEAYKYWGTDCLQRFNGMFAFALWDKSQELLFLARDRLGEKPLFFSLLPDGSVIFASELKALRQHPCISAEISPEALGHYLSLGYTLTSQPILRGVQQLEPAHFLTVQRGRPIRSICYWDLAAHFRQKQKYRDEREACEALSEILDDAVKLRLLADVPLGSFLSGGLDSSTIVATMCRLQPESHPQTFSIGFLERGYSELPAARAITQYLGNQHYDQMVNADMAKTLPDIVWYADQPFADTSMIPMYFLAQFARQKVTVCLSGDGSDELFAGYETYTADKLHYWIRWIPKPLFQVLTWGAHHLVPTTYNKVSLDYKLRQFLKGHAYSPIKAHYFWRTLFSEPEKASLVPDYAKEFSDSDPFQEFQKHQKDVLDCHYLDQAMYVDIKTWLADDILVKVDRSTMAHALESRVPFLDHRLVEFSASLPVELKMKQWQKKYILKQSQKAYLPKTTINRKKSGFNAPVSHWFTSSLSHFYEDLIDAQKSHSILSLFDKTTIRKLNEEHLAKKRDNSLKLLTLINFYLWLQYSK
jgi:asparagine synthase (glutamine-hydrolysing)